MTPDELNRRLKEGGIVPVAAREWSKLAHHFEEVECHDTFVAGDLVIVRGEVGLVAVEQPSPGERVLRRFSSNKEADRFVQGRLDQYERMWDGCGCRIDYYKDE